MRRFLRGLSAVTFVNVVNGMMGVVIVPIALQRLGVEGYGLYSIYPLLTGYLVLVELGLGKNLIRVLGGAQSEPATTELLRLALGLYAAIAVALLAVAPLFVMGVAGLLFRVPEAHVSTVNWITIIAIADYVLGIPVSLRLNFALSRERIGAFARFMLLSHTSRYLLMLAGVLLTGDVVLAVAFVLGRRVVELVAAPRLLPALPVGAWRPRFAWGESRMLLGQSSLLALTQLLQLSAVAAGSVLVNAFFGLAALGVYRSTFDVVSKVWFFSSTAGTVVFPRLIQLMRRVDARERLGRILPGIQGASWLAYSLVAVAGAVAAPAVIALLRLEGTSVLLFALLLVGVLWNAHAVVSIEVLQAAGRFREVGETAAVSFGVMTVVFLVLARREPALAIGWAWVGSQFIASSCVDAYALRPFSGRLRLGAVAIARVPGGLLAFATLGWIAGLPAPLMLASFALSLVLFARQWPEMRGSWLDLSARAPLAGT